MTARYGGSVEAEVFAAPLPVDGDLDRGRRGLVLGGVAEVAGASVRRSALAAEQAAGLAGLQAGLDRADLARGLGVVGLELEDLVEVTERFLVAADHALDAAEVEPGALGAVGLEHGALEDLAGLGGDRRLVTGGAELGPREHAGVVD